MSIVSQSISTQQFFDMLYPADQFTDDLNIIIWASPTKLSHYSHANKKIDRKKVSALESAETVEKSMQEVYFGLGLTDDETKEKRRLDFTNRAKAQHITAISCLWADIDIVGAGHKGKKRYPETIEKALELLNQMPLSPSIIVKSGGGLHVYWLLDKFFYTNTPELNSFGAGLVESWQKLISHIFSQENYVIDSTADLARVLRVPGTTNKKYKPPTLVETIKAEELRYSISDIKMALSKYDLTPVPKARANNGEVPQINNSIDIDLETEILKVLFENEPKCREEFFQLEPANKRHQNTVSKDTSPSAYEMSIANYAVNYGWSDEEIFGLLIYFRHYNKFEPKPAAHFNFTINKVRTSFNQRNAVTRLSGADVREREEMPEIDKESILRDISTSIGQNITGFKKLLSDPPIYIVSVDGRDITLGKVDSIMKENLFARAMFEQLKYVMPKIGPGWKGMLQHIADITEDISLGEAATPAGLHRSLLRDYFHEKPPLEFVEEYIERKEAFIINNDGYIYFDVEAYRQWIRMAKFEMIERSVCLSGLIAAGAEAYKFQAVMLDGEKMGKSLYRIRSAGIYHKGRG